MKAHSFNEQFEFSGKAKTWSIIAIVIGVLAIVFGFLMGHGERTFANLLLMGYYFACVCMTGIFFCAIQFVSQSGWSAGLLRIPQAFAKVLPYASVILVLIIAAGISLTHTVTEEGKSLVEPYLYGHWASHGLTDPTSDHYDALIAAKAGYLNLPFFFIRLIGFLLVYSIFGYLLVKYSENEDTVGGLTNYNKSFKVSAIFLVVFGFTSPLFSFDAIMSLEAHWFSTMFGWYNFAAMWVSGLCAIALIVILLKQNGYMSWITENHLHDLGKFIFAFSIFWCYVWFAQFLLIWYANMSEETVYFYKRWEPEFKPWFWLNIVINFVVPILALMTRDAKRTMSTLKWVCIILLCGHWLDYYMMVMPGTVGAEHRGFGVEEIGIAIGFTGLFTFLTLNALSKVSLLPKNHPFLDESLHHHI